MHLLPDIQAAGTFIGKLKKECCGVPQGAQVGLAFGDLQCSVLASTNVKSEAGNQFVHCTALVRLDSMSYILLFLHI